MWLELRHCHCLRNEMAHFCTDLQTYIMFEVLETAWDLFMAQLQVTLCTTCCSWLALASMGIHPCLRLTSAAELIALYVQMPSAVLTLTLLDFA